MRICIQILLACIFLSSCGLARFAHKTDVDYANTITEEELTEHLTIYASDEFAGRDTGTEGGEKAINYLVNSYREMEISSPKEDYKQAVPLLRNLSADVSVAFDGGGHEIGENFVNFFPSPDGNLDMSQVAYVNYGIATENYSNYENIDVTDKLVIMRLGEPMNADSTYLISGSKETSIWSNLRQSVQQRMKIAQEQGAKSAILILDSTSYAPIKGSYQMMSANGGRISLDVEDEEQEAFYTFFANEQFGEALLGEALHSAETTVLDKAVTIDYKNQTEDVVSHNVLAHVKGEEFPDEYIVISAHLDHVGTNDEGEIYNGADDDGSGTVSILEIAEAFQQAAEEGHAPKRSILFLHVTGEEKGLLGSRYYTDFDPIIPLDNTISNLNIDMIGRIDPKREGDRNYVYLIGSDKLSTELHELSEKVNEEKVQMELDYKYNADDDPNRFYYRSDHYNFAKNNIPVIFYFNGTHDDYHQPSDTVDKIEFDLLMQRARLIFYTAWELANRDERIVVDKAMEQ